MTDSFDMEGDGADLEEFQDWLDHVAEVEGTSRGSVLNDLVSTYWVLNELTEEIDADMGVPSDETTNSPDGETPAEIVEAIKAIGEMVEGQAGAKTGGVDAELLQLMETIRGEPDRGSTVDGYDVVRLEHRITRADDRLADLATDLDTLRSELTSLSSTVEDLADQDPEAVESRQDALEEVVGERIDWLEEKVDALYLELLETVEDQYRDIDAASDSIDAVDKRTTDLAGQIDHESQKRRQSINRLQRELGEFDDLIDAHRERTDDRLGSITTSFQKAIDDIEEHLHELYEADDETDERIDEVISVLDTRLESVFEAHQERVELEQLLERAQEEDIRSATCGSCDRTVLLDLLVRPCCPHCDRVFSGIETSRFLWRTHYELTTRRPGTTFETQSIESDLETAEADTTDDPDEVDEKAELPDLSILDSV